MRKNAYTENKLAFYLDTTIDSVRTKINSLRVQLGQEVTKVNKTKSGQSTSKHYTSN